jgi:hypothetical protein
MSLFKLLSSFQNKFPWFLAAPVTRVGSGHRRRQSCSLISYLLASHHMIWMGKSAHWGACDNDIELWPVCLHFMNLFCVHVINNITGYMPSKLHARLVLYHHRICACVWLVTNLCYILKNSIHHCVVVDALIQNDNFIRSCWILLIKCETTDTVNNVVQCGGPGQSYSRFLISFY